MSQTQKRSLAAIAARLMPSSLVRSRACARRSQQPVEEQTDDKDPLNPREARGGEDVPPVLLP